jgi:hypothetical protein
MSPLRPKKFSRVPCGIILAVLPKKHGGRFRGALRGCLAKVESAANAPKWALFPILLVK